MVGNHVADLVKHYGDSADIPAALTAYIKERDNYDYDYNEHGRSGNTHTAFVPDEVIDRFCLLGPPERHIERLEELESLGATDFAVYLQHDAKSHTLEAYGESIIPVISQKVTAKR
jgi:alkanesulfonate monooxygenase SsuD/methylene tetrahydromethanopterin reductase-like flavin-dependent oxidoreductase (luciferase family)